MLHFVAFNPICKAPLITCNSNDPMHSMGDMSSFYLYSFIFFKTNLFVFGPSMANWVILSIGGDEGNPFKGSSNKAFAVVMQLYWNCDPRYLVLETLVSKHQNLTWTSISSISRTELCESSNNTQKYGVKTWFINFCLIHGAMPNLIKYIHFVLPSVKLETVGLLLKTSLKNSQRPAHDLNDEWCFTALSTYFYFCFCSLVFCDQHVTGESWRLSIRKWSGITSTRGIGTWRVLKSALEKVWKNLFQSKNINELLRHVERPWLKKALLQTYNSQISI